MFLVWKLSDIDFLADVNFEIAQWTIKVTNIFNISPRYRKRQNITLYYD